MMDTLSSKETIYAMINWSLDHLEQIAQLRRVIPDFAALITSGNCFHFDSFNSVGVSGTIIFGMDCTAFSDINCQNSMGRTGNRHGTRCFTSPGPKSVEFSRLLDCQASGVAKEEGISYSTRTQP
jgi:hypothetical protein